MGILASEYSDLFGKKGLDPHCFADNCPVVGSLDNCNNLFSICDVCDKCYCSSHISTFSLGNGNVNYCITCLPLINNNICPLCNHNLETHKERDDEGDITKFTCCCEETTLFTSVEVCACNLTLKLNEKFKVLE